MADEKAPWWKPDAGTITGVLALVFSVYSIVLTNQQYSDSEGTALINETYATYHALHARRMDTVEISHIVCSPEEYPRVVALVREAASDASAADRARMQLRENAMAQDLFAQFEQTIYLHHNAVALGEKERARFLQDTLDYFSNVLLRNPRLVWMWSPGGGNLRSHYELFAQKYWDDTVGRKNPKMDAKGPFT